MLTGSSGAARLATTPAVALGVVLHTLCERAARREIPRVDGVEEDLRAELNRLVADASKRLAIAQNLPALTNLEATFTPLRWRQKVRRAVDVATRLLEDAEGKRIEKGTGKRLPSLTDLPDGMWAELPIVVPSLRLDGRVDLLVKDAEGFTIHDLKTGRVQNQEGEILPEINLQMRLYGLAVRELVANANVRLVVDYGEAIDIPFNEAEEQATRAWLADATSSLPAGCDVKAEMLAVPGVDCVTCSYRPSCGAYQRVVVGWWSTTVHFPLPLDTAGEVRDIVEAGTLADVTLKDMSGRTVRIVGVEQHCVSNVARGDKVWFFGLLTSDRVQREDWRHPLNFYQIGENPLRQRAWAMRMERVNDTNDHGHAASQVA